MEAGDRLYAAFAAMKARQWPEVLAALDGLEVPDNPQLMAKAWAYRGQAYQRLGQIHEADRAILQAIRMAKAAGDHEGVSQLRQIQSGLVASLAALRVAEAERQKDRALIAQDEEALLAGAATPAERAERHLRRAGALLDAGQPAEAEAAAARALACAEGEPRPSVMVSLFRARLAPDAPLPHLIEAWRLADQAGDMNLITAVAAAARAAGVVLHREMLER